MSYRVNWRITLPSNIEEQIYKGKIHISTSDGVASVIPVTVTALNENKSNQKGNEWKSQSEHVESNPKNYIKDSDLENNDLDNDFQGNGYQNMLGIRGLSERKLDFDVFTS